MFQQYEFDRDGRNFTDEQLFSKYSILPIKDIQFQFLDDSFFLLFMYIDRWKNISDENYMTRTWSSLQKQSVRATHICGPQYSSHGGLLLFVCDETSQQRRTHFVILVTIGIQKHSGSQVFPIFGTVGGGLWVEDG